MDKINLTQKEIEYALEHGYIDISKLDDIYEYERSPCEIIIPKLKKSNKRSRMIKYKSKLKKVAQYANDYAVIDEGFDGKERPLRRYRSSNALRFSFYKTHSNKKVRRYKGEIKNGNYYRRIFDYWWTID